MTDSELNSAIRLAKRLPRVGDTVRINAAGGIRSPAGNGVNLADDWIDSIVFKWYPEGYKLPNKQFGMLEK
jgi:hypothetical protein